MKLLIIHAKEFQISSGRESDRPKEVISVKSAYNFDPCKKVIVVLTCIEKNDTNEKVDKAVREIGKIYMQLSGKKSPNTQIKIIPFAHLSNNLMKPKDAFEFINNIFTELKSKIKKDDRLFLGDFGFSNEWMIKAYSHKLSCVFREID